MEVQCKNIKKCLLDNMNGLGEKADMKARKHRITQKL